MIRYFWIVLFIPLFFSCKINPEQQEKPVARVFDKYLYRSDFESIFPGHISSSDSTVLANDYIDKWIRRELLVNKAEINLSDDEKSVEEKIENYKSSLLIFKYEQNLIKQKVDTVITDTEVKEYYETNLSNFRLNNNIVKATFLQIPVGSPDVNKVRRWYRSDAEEDIKKLDAYAFQYAKKYDFFNDDWVDFREITNALPVKIENPVNFLKYRRTYEYTDSSSFHYFVNIKDYRIIGDDSPLEYIEQNIRTIIMNKRKVELVKKLEANIYNDALNRGYFTIY